MTMAEYMETFYDLATRNKVYKAQEVLATQYFASLRHEIQNYLFIVSI